MPNSATEPPRPADFGASDWDPVFVHCFVVCVCKLFETPGRAKIDPRRVQHRSKNGLENKSEKMDLLGTSWIDFGSFREPLEVEKQ